jgi:hypothetical protein
MNQLLLLLLHCVDQQPGDVCDNAGISASVL